MTVDCSTVLCYPVELFIAFIAIPVFMALFGFLRQPQIPAMLAFGGIFVLFLAVTTYGIIISYTDVMNTPQDTIYEVLSSNTGLPTNSITPARAEYPADTSSLLYDKTFDCMTIPLAKIGSPTVSELVYIGVIGSDGLMIKTFGTLNVTTMTSGTFFYDICLPEGDSYTIGSLPSLQERIGVRYNGGDGSNRIDARSDTTNPFDSTHTIRQTFTTSTGLWSSVTNEDLSMVLYLRGSDNGSSENVYEFTEIPKIFLALIGIIMMLCGALMVGRN